MPIKKTKKGCYQYGNTGKEYCGEHAETQTKQQAAAIHAFKNKEKDK